MSIVEKRREEMRWEEEKREEKRRDEMRRKEKRREVIWWEEMRWEAKRRDYMRREEERRDEKWSEVKVIVAWVQHIFIVAYEWHCTVCNSSVCTFVFKLFALCHSSCVTLQPTEVVISFLFLFYCFYMLCFLLRVFSYLYSFSLCTLLFLPSAVHNIEPRRPPLFYWFNNTLST
jgi:hypothetical protein